MQKLAKDERALEREDIGEDLEDFRAPLDGTHKRYKNEYMLTTNTFSFHSSEIYQCTCCFPFLTFTGMTTIFVLLR